MTTFLTYTACILAFDYINRKTTFFHPVGWAGVALLVAALITGG